MIINGKTVSFRIKNSGTFTASVVFNFLFQGEIKTHTSADILPTFALKIDFQPTVTDIHMFFHNKSVPGNPIFDEQVRQHAVPSCFLLTGDANYPICIPIPCSSSNYCNNLCANICNFNCF